MNAVDVHPDELLDALVHGTLSPEQQARLDAHVADCPACRHERTLAADCAQARASLPGDDALLERLVAGARRTIEARRGIRPARHTARRIFIAAAACLLVGSTVIAGTMAWRRSAVPRLDPTSPSVSPASTRRPPIVPSPSVAESAAPEVEQAVPQHPAIAPQRARPARVEPPRAAPTATAETLFARANLARRQGEIATAIGLYRELQRWHPGSPQELVSRVTLGRLLLDRMHDARGALAEFDSYLANAVDDSLRQEAMIGRALALGRLSRRADERNAWQSLLGAYPTSAWSERARARMNELQ